MKIGPLIQSQKDLLSAQVISNHHGVAENRAQLLELRTESGSLYVCPSRWQRRRLLWTFRHFRILRSNVLSRRERRLIERLSKSALVKPSLPVTRGIVFGVVEKVNTKPRKSGVQFVAVKAERVRQSTLRGEQCTLDLSRPGLSDPERPFGEESSHGYSPSVETCGSISLHDAIAMMYGLTERGLHEGFQQWRALAILSGVCIVMILVRLCIPPLLATTAQMRKPPTASERMRRHAISVSAPTVPSPSAEQRQRRVKLLDREPKSVARKSAPVASGSGRSMIDNNSAAERIEWAPVAPSFTSERLFVSELPQGHFVEPVLSDPNLAGELRLRVLIGTDGSIEEVTVVSGNPKLAEAGMRAVRRWHYSPYQAAGRPSEAETLIRMHFFGQDAVLVTPVGR